MLPPALATDVHVASGTIVAMPIRLRKFIGTVALFVLVIVWALVAMALAQAPGDPRQRESVGRLLRDRRTGLGFAGDADRIVDERPGIRRQQSESEARTISDD